MSFALRKIVPMEISEEFTTTWRMMSQRSCPFEHDRDEIPVKEKACHIQTVFDVNVFRAQSAAAESETENISNLSTEEYE